MSFPRSAWQRHSSRWVRFLTSRRLPICIRPRSLCLPRLRPRLRPLRLLLLPLFLRPRPWSLLNRDALSCGSADIGAAAGEQPVRRSVPKSTMAVPAGAITAATTVRTGATRIGDIIGTGRDEGAVSTGIDRSQAGDVSKELIHRERGLVAPERQKSSRGGSTRRV